MALGTYNFKPTNDTTHPIHVLTYKDKPVWIAQEIGAALGYSDPKKLPSNITGDWSERFREGVDFFRVEGQDLDALKRLSTVSVESRAPEPIIHPRTPSLLLLTESGLIVALALAKTPLGDRFRWWLADEVIPSIRKTGSYHLPQTQQADLFNNTALQPFKPTAAPHVAYKALRDLCHAGKISPEHHHEQLAVLVGRITGEPVRLLAAPMLTHTKTTQGGVEAFLKERCVLERGAETEAAAFRDAYERFCRQEDYPCANLMSLGHIMSRLGLSNRVRRTLHGRRACRCILGVRLLPAVIDVTPRELQ